MRAGLRVSDAEDTESQLHVHHKRYIKGRDLWDYPDDDLQALCKPCHEDEHFYKDHIKEMLMSLEASDVACLLAGMLSYGHSGDDNQLNNWRSLNCKAVNAGFIAASLMFDRPRKEVEFLAEFVAANAPDVPIFTEGYPDIIGSREVPNANQVP